MYNTYQNRLGTARKSMQDAGIEFDNAIRQAQLSNNETLAQNALKALQDKLNIALEGFNYKSEQENNRLNWNNTINNNYYNRYKDVESQINYENETAEKIRQYNENMAYQKEQQRLEQERWEKEMAYQREQDAIANAQKWASINASNNSEGYHLDGDKGTLDNNGKLNIVKNNIALNDKLQSWYDKNITKKYPNGISENQLENELSKVLSSGWMKDYEVSLILEMYGL